MPAPMGWELACEHHDAATDRAIVFDPFMGAGTTALAAMMSLRSFVGIELNPEYAVMAEDRLQAAMPLFADKEIIG